MARYWTVALPGGIVAGTPDETLARIRACADADLLAWLEWNDANGDWDELEGEHEALVANVAFMLEMYETLEDALTGEGYW